MADDDEEVISGPICSYLTYKSEGDRLYLLGEYEKAIQCYTHALQQEPKNRNCLVARSRCYLKMGNTTAALSDAEASQLGNKEFYKGLFRKAETLYAKGEFELALMFYHRGHNLRPDDRNFRLGIQKAREAIDNSVGSPSSVKLETTGDLSFFYRREEKVVPKTKSQLRRQKLNLKQQSKKQEHEEPKTNKTVRVLLGELYGDKEYLEKLLLDKELMKTNTESGGTIQDLIMSGIAFLDTRTEFWRQQKPIFARERERRLKEQSWKSNRMQPRSEHTMYLLTRLEQIDLLFADGRAQECQNKATELLRTVEGWSQRELPNKAEILGNLYSTIGNTQIELGDMEGALKSHQKDLRIARKTDNIEAKSRSLDNIGRVYARIGEFAKAVEAWMEKETLTKSNLERTWLFHEIGRCHLELNNNEEARDYGLKSLASAEKAGDEEWKMNASVLVAQAEIKLGNFQTAVKFFEMALDKSILLNDETAQQAISNALKNGKEQIEMAEKAKQEEIEQLREKQRASKLDGSQVSTDQNIPRTPRSSRADVKWADKETKTQSYDTEATTGEAVTEKGETTEVETDKGETTGEAETDKGETTGEVETDKGETTGEAETEKGETTGEAETEKGETTGEAETDKGETTGEAETDKGETTGEVETDKGETTGEAETEKGETTGEAETEKGETTGEAETDKGETTGEAETDKGETTGEAETEKGETTEEVETEKGETTGEAETDKGETTGEAETDKGERTEEVETDKGESTGEVETDKGETGEAETEKGETTGEAETEKGERTEEAETEGERAEEVEALKDE
ncbi:outer dynein arm-docking complex subunit 4 isoform X2 [Heptranchias perlo]|uniref:outer dynein arm-docking complex subunit 4 isoform X2 n=1 Tax=Heptranchias perlo TaxID=212740 RepID=UPI00355AC045